MTGLAIGVDVGGTKCLGVVVDDEARVTAEHRVPTPGDGPTLISTIAAVVTELEHRTQAPVAVGVGVPGLVDRAGVLRFAPNLPGIAELAVGAELRERLGRAVRVANDATGAAWAESILGAAAGLTTVVLVTLGTGIGGGLLVDGRLVEGANGFAGEIGHGIVEPDGIPCPCGQRGCWERYASGSALARLAQEGAWEGRARRVVELAGGRAADILGEHVTRAAGEDDPDAVALMARFGWWLAAGLANLANVFDPDGIVVGGGLVEAGDVLLGPTRSAFRALVEGAGHRPDVPIMAARLGERAGAIGAALLARRDALLGP